MTRCKKPKRASSALLICDMLNTFEFSEAKLLYPQALKAARAIMRLKKGLKHKKVPVIYVNDNFGCWLSDWKMIFATFTSAGCMGKDIAELLRPEEDDYFILKPKHSAFHSTSLEVLLEHMHAKNLIITGIAGNICVLFTAHDAHMREYQVTVPRDCIASNSKTDTSFVLKQLKNNFRMPTPTGASLLKEF